MKMSGAIRVGPWISTNHTSPSWAATPMSGGNFSKRSISPRTWPDAYFASLDISIRSMSAGPKAPAPKRMEGVADGVLNGANLRVIWDKITLDLAQHGMVSAH